ncbi:MAG TPA: hypothetical protein VHB73_02010 [Alphaproteobacteria bacterium]|nr:hypothetical protein [Alphaproteobacteria bacterium]
MAEPASPAPPPAPSRIGAPFRALKRKIKLLLFPIPHARRYLIEACMIFDAFVHRLRQLRHGRDAWPRLPVKVIVSQGMPLLRLPIKVGKPRAFVTSIHKAGTYLLHGILRELGLVSAGAHLGETGFYDHRDAAKQAPGTFREVKITCPLHVSARLVGPGQLAVGHVLPLYWTREALKNFRVFFAYREGRAVFVSHMRYLMRQEHDNELGTAWKKEPDEKRRMEMFMELYGKIYMNDYLEMADWLYYSEALPVRFESLCGDEGEGPQLSMVKRIAKHVDVELSDEDAKALIGKVLGASTKTWSGERSSLERYWSPKCEELFRAAGGEKLNLRFDF